MLSRDSEDLCLNLLYDLKKLLWQDELNPWVRCAFGNVSLVRHFFTSWQHIMAIFTTPQAGGWLRELPRCCGLQRRWATGWFLNIFYERLFPSPQAIMAFRRLCDVRQALPSLFKTKHAIGSRTLLTATSKSEIRHTPIDLVHLNRTMFAQKVIRSLWCSAVDCAHTAISTVLRSPT